MVFETEDWRPENGEGSRKPRKPGMEKVRTPLAVVDGGYSSSYPSPVHPVSI
jgi:hypothetical protein